MLGSKLNHVSKRGARKHKISMHVLSFVPLRWCMWFRSFFMEYTISADCLITQCAKASTTIVLTRFVQNILGSAPHTWSIEYVWSEWIGRIVKKTWFLLINWIDYISQLFSFQWYTVGINHRALSRGLLGCFVSIAVSLLLATWCKYQFYNQEFMCEVITHHALFVLADWINNNLDYTRMSYYITALHEYDLSMHVQFSFWFS